MRWLPPRLCRTRLVALAALSLGHAASLAHAEGIADLYPAVHDFFPGATRYGTPAGDPPAAPVYKADHLIGYVFLTRDVLQIPAYSGQPINNLVGFDPSGRITGVRIIAHEEPILVVGVTEQDLRHFVGQYRGKSVFDRISVGGSMRRGDVVIDAISGASITAMVENATVMKSARRVAASRGIGVAGEQTAPVTAATRAPPPVLAPEPRRQSLRIEEPFSPFTRQPLVLPPSTSPLTRRTI